MGDCWLLQSERPSATPTARMGCFVIEDLFAVGLGFDIAGAYLLARGLLAAPAEIARRSIGLPGFDPLLVINQARDRVDGRIGLFALLSGFFLQAVAYTLTLGGLGGGDGSLGRAIVAGALCALAAALVLLPWKATKERLLFRTLVGVARFNYEQRPMTESDKPYAGTLAFFAEELGYRIQAGESVPAFAKRVFGVEVKPQRVSHRESRLGPTQGPPLPSSTGAPASSHKGPSCEPNA